MHVSLKQTNQVISSVFTNFHAISCMLRIGDEGIIICTLLKFNFSVHCVRFVVCINKHFNVWSKYGLPVSVFVSTL